MGIGGEADGVHQCHEYRWRLEGVDGGRLPEGIDLQSKVEKK